MNPNSTGYRAIEPESLKMKFAEITDLKKYFRTIVVDHFEGERKIEEDLQHDGFLVNPGFGRTVRFQHQGTVLL
jgi:hypothetical protein